MLSNIIVGISNLPAYYAIKLSFNNSDYLTCAALSFVFSASFISHLTENHKHGMSGIGFSPKTSYILNRFDVLGCIINIIRFGYLYYSKYGTNFNVLIENKTLIYFSLLSFLLLRISEYDKYNPKLKNIYIMTHCLWHISIFTLIYHFLDKIIY
ncbi:putative membrane protein [Moumouvirus maliensis]|nr:putative membrane protein [Moumouvirus maliensis]